MAGAPAGPALDPERPADRLDAVRETDESRPVRRARRAQPPAGSARPPGASPPRPRCSPETLGSDLPPPRWRGSLSSTGAWRSLPRTTSGAGAAARRGVRRRAAVDVRREPQAHRARARRTRARRAAPLTITSSDRPSKPEVEPARKRERVAARIRSRTRSSSGRSSRSCRDRAAGPSAGPERAPS